MSEYILRLFTYTDYSQVEDRTDKVSTHDVVESIEENGGESGGKQTGKNIGGGDGGVDDDRPCVASSLRRFEQSLQSHSSPQASKLLKHKQAGVEQPAHWHFFALSNNCKYCSGGV